MPQGVSQAQQNASPMSAFHAGHGLALLIVLGLAAIFGLHLLGFRFVVAAGVGR